MHHGVNNTTTTGSVARHKGSKQNFYHAAFRPREHNSSRKGIQGFHPVCMYVCMYEWEVSVPEKTIAYASPMMRLPKALIIRSDTRRPSCVTSTALPRWKAAKMSHTTELEKPSSEWWNDSLAPLQSYSSPVRGFVSPHKRHSVDWPVAASSHWKECVNDSRVRPVKTNKEISTEVVIRAKMQLQLQSCHVSMCDLCERDKKRRFTSKRRPATGWRLVSTPRWASPRTRSKRQARQQAGE